MEQKEHYPCGTIFMTNFNMEKHGIRIYWVEKIFVPEQQYRVKPLNRAAFKRCGKLDDEIGYVTYFHFYHVESDIKCGHMVAMLPSIMALPLRAPIIDCEAR